jgi:hypothetical protein
MLRRLFAIPVLLALVASAAAAAPFKGTLYTPPSTGLDGTGFWAIPSASSLSWSVDLVSGLWKYNYTLTVPQAEVSHSILETSGTFKESYIASFSVLQGTAGNYSVGLFGAPPNNNHALQPNPYLPIVWNVGLTDVGFHRIVPRGRGLAHFHILVPDTASVVPEPATVLLGATGLLSLLPLRRALRR